MVLGSERQGALVSPGLLHSAGDREAGARRALPGVRGPSSVRSLTWRIWRAGELVSG